MITRPSLWRNGIGRGVVLCCMLIGGLASASYHSALLPNSFQAVGSGDLTWFGFNIYRATLLAPAGRFDASNPHALHIEYRKSFSRQQLAEESVSQIEHLRGESRSSGQMLAAFVQVFCDVSKGDQITGFHMPGEGASFYCGKELIGRIDDAELAKDFFSIWLDPNTSEPKLRAQLLGEVR